MDVFQFDSVNLWKIKRSNLRNTQNPNFMQGMKKVNRFVNEIEPSRLINDRSQNRGRSFIDILHGAYARNDSSN
jgi:hypothetical protein